jgi:hypothetical protein
MAAGAVECSSRLTMTCLASSWYFDGGSTPTVIFWPTLAVIFRPTLAVILVRDTRIRRAPAYRPSQCLFKGSRRHGSSGPAEG